MLRRVCLISVILCRASFAQEIIPLTALSGYSPNALWVKMFTTHFIPEVDRQLAPAGNYQIDWNTPFGTVARPGGAFDAIQYDLGDIGIIVTPFHADKLPFFNISYVTPFVTTDIGLVVRTVSDLNDRYPVLKDHWQDFRQVYLVTAGLVDAYQAVMSDPIVSLDDFQGLKMSGVGMNLRYFEGLGTVGVPSSVADFYTNMATGLTAGAIVWPEAIMGYSLNEVGPYMVDVRLAAVSSV
jgi:TRAP-type mannitol/chloroaromatic compound transport system substrate-binding protein